MSHKEIIGNLLRIHGTVTLRMLFDAGVGYTARNRIGDLKKEGWEIGHYFHQKELGETHSDNAYIYISEPKPMPKVSLAPVKLEVGDDGQVKMVV